MGFNVVKQAECAASHGVFNLVQGNGVVTGIGSSPGFEGALAVSAPSLAPFSGLAGRQLSGSVDAAEYRLQVEGLTLALADPDVRAALEGQAAAVAVMQWSGPGQQSLSIPWRAISCGWSGPAFPCGRGSPSSSRPSSR